MSQPSALLNRPLPAELDRLLRQEGFDPAKAWVSTDTDLNLKGAYEQVFILAFEDQIITAGPVRADYPKAVRLILNRADIKEVRSRQGVGGGFLEVLVEGVFVEVLAYSNARADTFRKVRKKLREWAKGNPVHVGPEDDVNTRKCSKCGMTLQFKGDVCRRCVNRGAVFARVLKMMRPYRGRAILMMLLVLVGIGISLIPQKLVGTLIDYVLAPEKAGHPTLSQDTARVWLLAIVAGLFGTYLLGSVLGMIVGRLASYVGTQITFDMRERVFNHLTKLGIDY